MRSSIERLVRRHPVRSVASVFFLTTFAVAVPAFAGADAESPPAFCVTKSGAGRPMILYATITPAQVAAQSKLSLAMMMRSPAHVEQAASWSAASDPTTGEAMYEMMTTDLREQVASIRTPVLVVAAAQFAKDEAARARVRASYEAQVARVKDHRVRVIPDRDLDLLLDVSTDARSAAADLIAREDLRRLADAIDALPDEAREVVALYYREGQSVRQVADLLGMREDAVKQRLSRARQRLRASLLNEMGETLRASAPGAAFTAGVMALTVAAPSSAAAASLGAASKALGWGVMMKASAALGGAALGAISGVGGVLIGTRRLKRLARDDQERRALRTFTSVAVTTVLVACAAFPLGWMLTESQWAPIATYVILLGTLGVLYQIWLPRIIARRLAAELRDDPTAARRQRRDRIVGWIGLITGALTGGLGLLAGLWS
jgi:RNA polymerase sigma factor (sigma-70 family)